MNAINLSKYPRLAAMLARNPNRGQVVPGSRPPEVIHGLFQHFKTDADRNEHLQYVKDNAATLPF